MCKSERFWDRAAKRFEGQVNDDDPVLSHRDRIAINGAMFKLGKRVEEPDDVMNNKVSGKRLWDELVRLTGLTPG